MDNHEQMYSADEFDHNPEQIQDTDESDHNPEQAQDTDEFDHNPEQIQDTDESDHNPEQAQDTDESDDHRAQTQDTDEFDYDREPPLDRATTNANSQRSKYVFMTLCFLLALILLYTYITNYNSGNSSDWFPLVGAIVLGILGVIFLRSSDGVPDTQLPAASVSKTAAKTLSPFEELVQEALAAIPEEFHEKMENVTVQVEHEPDAGTLARVGVNEGHTLLGLYEGVPLTAYGRHHAPYPEVITIYQRPIEDYCRHNPTRIREQVRSTVLHEVAHHFGMGHEEMPIWVK
jgi:predicted Zn-dependent protease with MMP-like domain